MESSSSLLPRHHSPSRTTATATTADPPPQPSSSQNRRRPRRRRRPPRSKLPSQDRLVVAFVSASAIFSLIAISPFIVGNFPSDGMHEKDWLHKHSDGHGGVSNLAGNKTLLAWHHMLGKKQLKLTESRRSNRSASKSLARGVSGLPMSKTPALIGAQHGSLQCPSADGKNENSSRMDELAYWNEPQGESDISFVSPFAPTGQLKTKRYVTFEPDSGGWNNIRMSLEIVIVFAAATGRTLVLPPDTPFYLLTNRAKSGKKGKNGAKHRGFADFFNLKSDALRKKVIVITMKEFLEIEGATDGGDDKNKGDEKLFTIPGGSERNKIWKSAEYCYYKAKSDRPCDTIYSFLRSWAYVPELQAGRDCLIFDADWQSSKAVRADAEIFASMPEFKQIRVKEFCHSRNPIFFGNELASAPLIHFHANEKHHRLLNHFYTFLYFTDTKVDHHFKRFVRDFLHYKDAIWCTAGKVILSLEGEAVKMGEPQFSAMHVRRGDFQYKKQKITGEDWYKNTKDLFHPYELIYIATDEKNRTFFEPLSKHYTLRFLADFTNVAGLNEIDPSLMGMIDTIVASQGRIFVGTWLSTFTGFINRMRGYYGMPGTTSYYSTASHKEKTHKWENPHGILEAREWPTAWVGIDGDEVVSEERSINIENF